MPFCALCLTPCDAHQPNEIAFCCYGCQAVHTILEARGELSQFRETSLFKEAVKAGVVTNPNLIAELGNAEDKSASDKIRLQIEIGQLWCPACAEVISFILLKHPGVLHCAVDYATDLAVIEYDVKICSKEAVFKLIESLGYLPNPIVDSRQQTISKDLVLRFIWASFFSLNIMMLAYPIYATYADPHDQNMGYLLSWISAGFTLPVVTYCAFPIFKRAWQALLCGIIGMECLVTLSVLTGCLLSFIALMQGSSEVYFDAVTAIIALVLFGKILESKAKGIAKGSLMRLAHLLPRRCRKRIRGEFQFVLIKELKLEEEIGVFKGEKCPVDGVILEGEGLFDEALLTGESVPRIKRAGDSVIAGSILTHGTIILKVSALPEDSFLQQMMVLVDRELGGKSDTTKLADRISKVLVPLVIGIAISIGLWNFYHGDKEAAVTRALSVLLVACPCAIGIAAPLAEANLIYALAEKGLFIRQRSCLDQLSKITTFIFDKTGTLTTGGLHVLKGLDEVAPSFLCALKGMTRYSNHPISVAIHQSIKMHPSEFEQIEEIPGRGLKVGDYCLGSSTFLKEEGIALPQETGEGLLTLVYFTFKKKVIATIALGDHLRMESPKIIKGLGNIFTELISGDGEFPVRYAAKACGFKTHKSGFSPLQKRERVLELQSQGHVVAMVGDGINDAPALAASQVGISMMQGTDLSVYASTIVLTHGYLEPLLELIPMGKKGQTIVRQNLFWAFSYNLVGVGLAIFGLLTPIYSAIAMVISSCMVTLNSLRIR